MDLIADLLLIAAALGAAFYCFVLSRRLSALNSAEGGIGAAIGTLSEQVARLEQTLETSRGRAEEIDSQLRETVKRAEDVAAKLSSSVPPQPDTATRPSAKALQPRHETQPASFRRRLFAEASGDHGS